MMFLINLKILKNIKHVHTYPNIIQCTPSPITINRWSLCLYCFVFLYHQSCITLLVAMANLNYIFYQLQIYIMIHTPSGQDQLKFSHLEILIFFYFYIVLKFFHIFNEFCMTFYIQARPQLSNQKLNATTFQERSQILLFFKFYMNSGYIHLLYNFMIG